VSLAADDFVADFVALGIPIVALGTHEAFYALQSDTRLTNRFVPANLPEWSFNRDFKNLLASFERAIELK